MKTKKSGVFGSQSPPNAVYNLADKANRTSWAMQNDPQAENLIKKALRTRRAFRQIK